MPDIDNYESLGPNDSDRHNQIADSLPSQVVVAQEKEDAVNAFLRTVVTPGKPACALFSAIIAVALILLVIKQGIGTASLVIIAALVGLFVGGIKEKQQAVKNAINRMFPPKA